MLQVKYIVFLISLISVSTVFSQSKGYYNKKLFDRYKHEYSIGIGISSCQTDVGGSNYSTQELNEKFGGKIFRSIYDTGESLGNYRYKHLY
jgi:hypothetical protein